MKPRYLSIFAAGVLALLPALSHAQTIAAGTNAGAFSANVPGTNYILNDGDTRSQGGGTDGVSFGAAGTSGTYNLTIDGLLIQTGSGRALRTANVSAAGGHTFNLNVGLNGLIRATSDDAVQGRFTGSGNYVFNATNLGTIYSGPNLTVNPASAIATGQALDLASASGGSVVNGSTTNSTALIRADGHDAVRLGNNMTFTNYGTVLGNSVVNDSPANNVFNAPPNNITTETFSASEGVSFETGTNSSLNNHGTISGARHGVEAAETATGITVNNLSTGSIIGRNGSGVGFDTTTATASDVVIVNDGEIRGKYAGSGNVIDRTGTASFTNDGDGDGVDVDGAATITNNGLIFGEAAGGFDTGGRANSAEGVAIGGGTVLNNASGIIRGGNRGILANNDSNLNRSAIAATSVTNAGLVEGLNGFAIRFEGNFADTITNSGTINGSGAIPEPTATVLRQDGSVDPANGTLDGVTYSAGSARFIRGDGSAVQTGDGNDVVTNSGTISGSNGRAITLEGGDDTLNIQGGTATITGAVDGGSGTDTLNFDLGVGNSFDFGQELTGFEAVNIQSGTVTLGGDSTYIGTTTVTAGTLIIDGTHSGNGDLIVQRGAALGGDGTISGSLSLQNGASFVFNPGSTLTVNGASVDLGNLGIASLLGLDSSTSNGTYTLINGSAVFDFADVANLGFDQAAALGGGKSAYFQEGSLNVIVVPEPGTAGLLAGGLAIWLLGRRLRLRSASRQA